MPDRPVAAGRGLLCLPGDAPDRSREVRAHLRWKTTPTAPGIGRTVRHPRPPNAARAHRCWDHPWMVASIISLVKSLEQDHTGVGPPQRRRERRAIAWLPESHDAHPGCSRTGASAHGLTAGQREPGEPRGSCRVLRAAAGATPAADSPRGVGGRHPPAHRGAAQAGRGRAGHGRLRLSQEKATVCPKGAQTRSCSSPVLVEQATEQVSSIHAAPVSLADDRRSGGPSVATSGEAPALS
jgi:hypothetical protein